MVRQTERRIGGDGAADGDVGVLGEIEKFARGELRVRGDVGADLRILVGGERAEEVRRRARVGREEGEDLGVLRGLREVFEEVTRRERVGGDELLRGGGLGEFGEFLEEARGNGRLAEGDGGLAHAVAADAFEDKIGRENFRGHFSVQAILRSPGCT